MPGEDGRGLASDMSRARSDIAYGPPRADRDAGASDPRLLCAAAVMRRCSDGLHTVQKDEADGEESPVRALLPLWLRMNMEIPTAARTDARPPPSLRAIEPSIWKVACRARVDHV